MAVANRVTHIVVYPRRLEKLLLRIFNIITLKPNFLLFGLGAIPSGAYIQLWALYCFVPLNSGNHKVQELNHQSCMYSMYSITRSVHRVFGVCLIFYPCQAVFMFSIDQWSLLPVLEDPCSAGN